MTTLSQSVVVIGVPKYISRPHLKYISRPHLRKCGRERVFFCKCIL